ncbi:MAG: RNA polymerase sigma-70 factor (ECF subfamily) [Polyangiales bacterium]|jgi:RNA polymerase sigma-70 factor (ECF subfamily)
MFEYGHTRNVGSPPQGKVLYGPWLASAMDEAELLTKASEGDRSAFGHLVKMHQGRVSACATKMLTSPSEAEDAAQETFIRAWKALARFDGRSKLSTWLYRICVNVCLNRIRSQKGKRHADLDDPSSPDIAADSQKSGNDPGHALELSELQARLQASLDRLSPSLRSAVVLVLIEGMPHKEAGDVLGVPEGTVAWRIHEARRRLRGELKDLARPRLRSMGTAS